MRKRLWIAIGAVTVLGGWGWVHFRLPGTQATGARSAREISVSAEQRPGAAQQQSQPPLADRARASQGDVPVQETAEQGKRDLAGEVQAALGELAELYRPAGLLQVNKAKAVIDQRKKHTEALMDRLAQLGPGGAAAIEAGYAGVGGLRARRMLIEALGRIEDPEAVSVLDRLLDQPGTFSLRKECVLSLGRRPDATEALSVVLRTEEDARLRFLAAQSLAGRSAALPVLAECLRSEQEIKVKSELIGAIGAVGSPEALSVLAEIAREQGETALRETAIRELGRAFDNGAAATLVALMSDDQAVIRTAAEKTLNMVRR